MQSAEERILQNLLDAGCDAQTIQEFLTCRRAGDLNRQLCLLAGQRKRLLAGVHRQEQQICCLDYLVFQLETRRAPSAQKETKIHESD